MGTAIRTALGGGADARYFDAAADLDGDGVKEIVAYAAGPMVCGTGGCPMYVLRPDADGLRLITTVVATRTPVRLSPYSTKGWRDLIVGIGGGGMASGNAELSFDGTSYPPNATVPPAKPVTNLDGTEILIPDFNSYTDGKVVPPAAVGDAAQPVAGRVLGADIHASGAEKLRFYVLRTLTDRYAADKGIAVTPAEVDSYLAHRREVMRTDPNFGTVEEDSAQDRAAEEQSADAFIRQWKIDKAIYEQYGGRIIFQQGGPEPLDAYREILEEAQTKGEFTIATPELEKEFWQYYRDDSRHEFFPPGSPQEKQAFTVAPWAS